MSFLFMYPISKVMKMNSGVFEVNSKERARAAVKPVVMETDLEDALDLAGVGKYQVLHCLLVLSSLSSAILEMIGFAFLLPAAACDLNLPDHLKGIITSIPNIGVILTAPLWGRAADHWGRKPALLVSCAGTGLFCILAALMPTLLSFALCKFAGSLFLACPSSLGFVYAGELVPRKRRDIALLLINGLLTLSTTLSPLLAWGVLAADWRYTLGTLTIRPWRLLTVVYAAPLLLTALWVTNASESPKFLLAKGKSRQALEVIKHIFSKNSGLPPEEFCVTSLKSSPEQKECIEDGSEENLTPKLKQVSALALLRPPHFKWMALIGFLMFGLSSSLNGLFLFATDTINKVLQETPGPSSDTVCMVINQVDNSTTTDCIDSISPDAFFIMVVTTAAYGVVVLAASMCPLSKKTLLISMFLITGIACLLSGVLTNKMVAASAMSALQLTSFGIGPLTAYAVYLFPTSLRGTAVGSVIMCGRLGSVFGANAAGYFLAVACSLTFYGFTTLLLLCAALSLLLPKTEATRSSSGEDIAHHTSSDCR